MFENKFKVKLSVGAPSIIMIFVVLLLTVFAVLSYLTANNDYKLTEKYIKNTSQYYIAVAAVQEKLAEIDSFSSNETEGETSFYVNINEGKSISCVVEIKSGKAVLKSMSIVNEQGYIIEDDLNVWVGE